MKMALDSAAGKYLVKAYEPGKLTLSNGQSFSSSTIVLDNKILTDWAVPNIAEINAKQLRPICENPPEILILGTGEKQIFPPPKTFIDLIDLRIGFEVMDNAAACRTFNIVVSEGRKSALAIYLPNS